MNQGDQELRTRVLLRLQVALLGEVRPHLRGVAVSWNKSEISVRMFYDGISGEDETEIASDIEGELAASFFPEYESSVSAERLDYPARLNDIEGLDAWVYRRWEQT